MTNSVDPDATVLYLQKVSVLVFKSEMVYIIISKNCRLSIIKTKCLGSLLLKTCLWIKLNMSGLGLHFFQGGH